LQTSTTFHGSPRTFFSHVRCLELVKSKFREQIRRNEKVERPLRVAEDLAAGALSGVVNNLCTLPFDVVATNNQVRNLRHNKRGFYAQYADTAKLVRETGGIMSFWRGLLPSCLLVVNPAVNFALFEQLKVIYISSTLTKKAYRGELTKDATVHKLSALEAFIIGATSKAVATTISYPLIRAKILMMDSSRRKDPKTPDGAVSDERLHSMLGVLYEAVSAEGIIGGLYKGLGAQLARSTLAAAIMFTTREKLEGYVSRRAQSFTKSRKQEEVRAGVSG
jgi:adenine nucleotide transporter 17